MKPTYEQLVATQRKLEARVDILERAVEALLKLHTADVRKDLLARLTELRRMRDGAA